VAHNVEEQKSIGGHTDACTKVKQLKKKYHMTLTELKQLFELLNGNRSSVEKALESIKQGYVTIDELLSDEYMSDNYHYYSSEDYVMTHSGDIIYIDNSFWCEGMDEYFHNDDMVKVYEGSDEMWYSQRYAERNSDYSYFDGSYYDECALDRHDIVWVEDTGELCWREDVFYHDGEGYYSYPEGSYVRGYHNGSYQSLNFDNKSKYKIGYEIEKEDEDVRNSIDIEDFENETDDLWRKEKDGSLNDESGYELISPTFEFNIDKIFEHIEGNHQLVAHIEANTSTSCGGHIHLSENGLSGDELFEKVKGYTPLFYALYYGRVDKNYSKGKSNKDLQNENEKYQAIKIHHDRIEFRIISAVPNVKTLRWRTKLLRMILENPTNDIIKAYYNVDTKFTKLLKQTYSDEKLVEVKERFIKFTKQFEDINIIK
jgi:hypothetical protein